jgi:hypothetical protein
MNKLFSILVLVLISLNIVQAQEGYVKFIMYSEYRDKSIKCYKGEIFPFIKSKKGNKINIIVGNDTVTDLKVLSKNFITINNLNTSYLADSNMFIKSKDGENVFLDASNISKADTVTLISESGKILTQLEKMRQASIRKSECGKIIRLVISNTPTIFYSIDKLQMYYPPITDRDGDSIADKNDSCPDVKGLQSNNGCPEIEELGLFARIAWWIYLLFILGIVCVGFLVWFFFLKNKQHTNKTRLLAKYSGGSLSEFAEENNLSLIELIKLNKGSIPKNYYSMNEFEKKNAHKELKRIGELTIGYTVSSEHEKTDDIGLMQLHKDESSLKESGSILEANKSNPFNNGSEINVTQQIRQLESNLIREIRSAGSKGNEGSNEITRLKGEITNLKYDNNNLSNDKQYLDSTISQLKIDKDNLKKNIDLLNSELNQRVKELSHLQEKVITVEYLSGYCDSVLTYFKLCNQVSSDAYNYFNRISHQDIIQASAIGHLLMKFQNSINDVPFGNWMQNIQDIKNTGATTNKKLIRSFSQIQSEEERKREFQRLLFSEVLVTYSSSILILAEAFRNLGRFQASSEIVNDAQNTFTKYVSDLVSKVKATGLENKYVPLFKNFEEFLGLIESVDREKSFAYKGIIGLEKGAVVEIVSYGVKTSFEETKTLIILE